MVFMKSLRLVQGRHNRSAHYFVNNVFIGLSEIVRAGQRATLPKRKFLLFGYWFG
jgi:hypothetical protein